MIICQAQNINGPVGLYAERELPYRYGIPHRLFKENRTTPRRLFEPGSSLQQPG